MKRIIIGAAVLTGLAALGAACTSAAAPAANNRVQVLRLHTTDLSEADNPAGHGGPGDVFTVVYDLRTPAGAEAGKAYLSCTSATPSVNLCHAAYVLKGGQIDVQVAVTGTATGQTLAVTGGTGAYAGVTGWARAVDTGPHTSDRTFYLIRSGQN